MHNAHLGFFLGFLFIFTCLLAVGLYLSFVKTRKDNTLSVEAWINSLNISASAKKIKLREFDKLTAKKFTREWFLEYWYGQRSAVSAWLTWGICGGVIVEVINIIFVFMWTQPLIFVLLVAISLSLKIIYTIITAVILWGCAVNTTPFYQYLTRVAVIFFMINQMTSILY